MADPVKCYVRRIDFEPKADYLDSETYAHVFLKLEDGTEINVYTKNPRFEAAFLTAFSMGSARDPNAVQYIEVKFETVNKENKVTQVILDREFQG